MICFEQRGLEHARRPGGFVAVLVEEVPPAEYDVIEGGQGKQVTDPGRPALGPLAEANRAHLGQRTDGFRQALADGENAGDEGRADGTEAYEENAEFALCWRNLKRFHRESALYHSTMALFRNARPQEPLIVSITGVRMGHRIVGVIGSHPGPFLDMAAKVGITGGAYALTTDSDAVSRVQAAAVEHGVLLDAGPIALPLPLPDGSFDLVLVDDREPRDETHCTSVALLTDLRRVLRPGGRIILAVPAPTSALAGLFGITSKAPDVQPLLDLLRDTGFIAARLLAAREGVGYVEAARPM